VRARCFGVSLCLTLARTTFEIAAGLRASLIRPAAPLLGWHVVRECGAVSVFHAHEGLVTVELHERIDRISEPRVVGACNADVVQHERKAATAAGKTCRKRERKVRLAYGRSATSSTSVSAGLSSAATLRSSSNSVRACSR
jgi:hypothetical protein